MSACSEPAARCGVHYLGFADFASKFGCGGHSDGPKKYESGLLRPGSFLQGGVGLVLGCGGDGGAVERFSYFFSRDFWISLPNSAKV